MQLMKNYLVFIYVKKKVIDFSYIFIPQSVELYIGSIGLGIK